MRVFATGSNCKGQFGLGSTEEGQKDVEKKGKRMEECSIFREILSFEADGDECEVLAAVGANHTLISLLNSNFLWVAGHNEQGQLGGGIKDHDVVKMKRYKVELGNHKIHRLFCGWDYSFLIDDLARVWSTGCNKYGLIGHSVEDSAKRDWSLIPTSNFSTHDAEHGMIRKIACGWRHTLFLSLDGHVFGCGDLAKVCLGDRIRRDAADVVSVIKQLLFSKKIIDLACGMFHSVFLDESYNVIVIGRNSCAKHGIFIQDYSKQLEIDDYPIAVYSGWSSLSFETKCGSLFTWGRADLGQLGRQEVLGCSSTPARLIYEDDHSAKVRSVSMGSESCLVLLETGKVLVFGFNDHGNLGLGHTENVMTPTYTATTESSLCFGVASGFGHSLIWCD